MNHNLDNSKIRNPVKKFNLNYKDLIIFLIPFCVFLFYLYIYNPGILTYDSFNQMHQISSGKFTNGHPFFHTFIEMVCIRLYGSPISIAILQIITFSTLWTAICKYNRKDIQEITFNKQFIFQIIVTLFVSLVPINAVYAITLWKDILFCYSIMFLCFLLKIMIDKEGKVDYKFVILISLTMSFIAKLRFNGTYIIIIMLFIIAIYLFKKNRHQKLYISIPVLTIIFILLISSLNFAYDVEDTEKDAMLAKTVHLLSYDDLHIDLDDVDRKTIHKLVNETEIQDKFEMTYTDPIYRAANGQVFSENKSTYIGIVIKYALKDPKNFIDYLLGSSPIVWDITRDSDWVGKVTQTDVVTARNMFYNMGNKTSLAAYDNVTPVNLGTPMYNATESFVHYTEENVVWDTLFNSPAFYMYLSLIILLLLDLITKTKNIYLIYLPNMLNILIVFVSTPIQANRYLYSNLLVFYLLLIILIGVMTNKKKIKQPS